MREMLLVSAITLAGIVFMTAAWTFLDRKFPSARIPFIYREQLWQNILINFILATIISVVIIFVI
jgi:hypothetical protein